MALGRERLEPRSLTFPVCPRMTTICAQRDGLIGKPHNKTGGPRPPEGGA
jgi:hypothetical protein